MFERNPALDLSPLRRRSRDRELIEEAHEIGTGTMRAQTSSPRTLLGNTDHADIVHLPDTRGAGPHFARVDPISTAQDRFATGDPRSARIRSHR